MAQVYVATHTRMPRQFAVKVLSPLLAAQTALVERFRREIDILARLKHPHIVDVMDCHQTALGQPYLVMELLVGEDLDHFLRRSGRLPRSVALAILSQIGAALAAAHESGVIHRDLKPANIFLCQDGPQQNLVKVLDFGVAKPAARVDPRAEREPYTAGGARPVACPAPRPAQGPRGALPICQALPRGPGSGARRPAAPPAASARSRGGAPRAPDAHRGDERGPPQRGHRGAAGALGVLHPDQQRWPRPGRCG